ncbi:endonuclease NucS [Natronobiforma cellulositropha]|uniref:endonuclease NucS n=1 Tax=Natronobiforma cellulositropha TaxID=1679076 RepID=UPI0021D5954B|nr:endonuclease NucS [Natronobiforma cellulositropha]
MAAPRALTRQEPSLETAAEVIEEGIAREALVTVFGRCRVAYDGRASSRLGPGERHVMCKPDGAALVHTATGQRPVNWLPPGASHRVSLERVATDPAPDEDTAAVTGVDSVEDVNAGTSPARSLHLESTRPTPEERLRISFERVHQVSAFVVADDDISVVGTEADLRERLLADPDLVEPGFTPLATERETPAGAVDIYGEDRAGRVVVVELKRRRVGPDAVGQLRRYVDALERDLHADVDLRGILVAPSVTDRAARLLERNGLEFVALEPTLEE